MEFPSSAHEILEQIRDQVGGEGGKRGDLPRHLQQTSQDSSRSSSDKRHVMPIPKLSFVSDCISKPRPPDNYHHLSEMHALDDAHMHLNRIQEGVPTTTHARAKGDGDSGGREEDGRRAVHSAGLQLFSSRGSGSGESPTRTPLLSSGRPAAEAEAIMNELARRERKTVTFSDIVHVAGDQMVVNQNQNQSHVCSSRSSRMGPGCQGFERQQQQQAELDNDDDHHHTDKRRRMRMQRADEEEEEEEAAVAGGSWFRDDEELTSTPLVQTPVLPFTITQSSRRRTLHGVRSRMSFAPSSIVGIELGLLSEDEIRRMAFPITETEKLSENGVPKIGGVNDPRQGVTQNRFLCPTCGCDALECNGHLGMIVLPWPVYNVGQFLSSIVENLNLVCWACCNLRVERGQGAESNKVADARVAAVDANHPPGIPSPDRVSALSAAFRNIKVCPHCEAPQPMYVVAKPMNMIAWNWLVKKAPSKKFLEAVTRLGPEMVEETNRPFTAARAYDILAGVSDADWLFCGVDPVLSHPKNKILRVLPVPPNCIRPTFSSTEGSSMQGMPDMTTILHTHIAKTVSGIWKVIAKGREDDRSAYRGGVAPDHVSEEIWRKRSWQDLVPSQVFKKARAAMALEMMRGGGGGGAGAGGASGTTGGGGGAGGGGGGNRGRGRGADDENDDALSHVVYTQAEKNAAAVAAAAREMDRLQQAPQIMSGPKYAAEKRRTSSHSIVAKLGGNWTGDRSAKDIIFKTRVADPTEEQRVRALVESTRPDVMCKTARTFAPFGVEGAEWAVAALPHEYEKLQLVIASLYLNDDRTMVFKDAKQRNGAPLRGIDMFLKGKTGLVKGSLMAVRSFFSARSVVTAAAGELDMDELGVPADFARTLTFPERVNETNIHSMRRAVSKGPNVLGGATTIIRAGTGERIYLTHIARSADRLAIQLKVGDVVERHLLDGDYVMINRQPTLHKGSFLVKRVRIREHIMCFQLPVPATNPLNCDFDGDEINMHVPQTVEAMAELQQLMASQWQIMLPKNNAPCIGPVQDLISGLLRITRKDVFLTRGRMMHLVAQMRYSNKYAHLPSQLPPPAILFPKRLWTGKQVVSILLPRILNLERTIEGCNPEQAMDADERAVCIQAGELLSGVLTKATAGISAGGIIQRITMDGGARMIKEYISDMTRVIHEWFREHGFSIGIDDVTMPAWAHRDAHRTLASAEIALTRAEWLRDAQEGTISEVDTARLEIAAFAGMSAALERASDVERAQRESTPWTRERALDDMIRSGSKGKNENRESLKVGLGVTIVGAARVGRDARGKTIPGFLRYEPSPAAQGFVRGNYMDGINPMEYYFHAMAGRRGLADTAVKTSETGYMQKRGTKVMEDKVARCDGSVRGRMGIVVQACYGGDGMDPMKIELVELPALAMGDSELCAQAGGSAEYQSVLLELRDAVRCIRFSPSLPAIESRVQLPIHAWNSGWCCSCPKPIELFLRNSIFPPSSSLSNEEGHAGAGAGSGAAGDDADTCCCSCSEVLLKFYSWMVRRHGVKCTSMLLSALWELRPSRIVANGVKRKRQGGVDLEKLEQALTIVASRYERALVCEGEAAGIVAAQSIGEPSTQMTLNTFHTSGKGNAHMSMGVPRIHEIFDKRKSESMVSRAMTLLAVKNTRAAAEAICRKLKRVALSDVVHVDCFVVKDPVAREFLPPQPSPVSVKEQEQEQEQQIQDQEQQEMRGAKREEGGGAGGGLAEEDAEMLEQIASIFGWERDLDPEGTHFSPFVIRIQLDQKKLFDLGIASPMTTIVNAIKNVCTYPVSILHSDESSDAWVIRVRIWDPDESPNSPLKSRTISVRLYAHILSSAQANGAQKLYDPSPCEVLEVYVDQKSKRMAKRSRWGVSIRGSSLPTAALIDGVDWERSVTNDLNEIEREMGICAAEDAIAAEMYRVFTYDGSHVDKRHLSLVASAMTATGRWYPLTRHGLSGMKASALHQATFEQTSSKLREGAASGETDLLDNPAGAMCVGASVPVGTGCVAVIKEFKLPVNTPVVTRKMMMELQNGMIRQSSVKPKRKDTGAVFDARTGMELKQAARSVRDASELAVTTGPQQAFTPAVGDNVYAQARVEHALNYQTVDVQTQVSEKAAQIIQRAQQSRGGGRERGKFEAAPIDPTKSRGTKRGRGESDIIERGMRDVVRSKRHVLSASVDDPFGTDMFGPDSFKKARSRNTISDLSRPQHKRKVGITTTFVNQFGKVQDVIL